jgi:two-component system, LuxR family, sensor kinase FixL
VPFSRPSQPVIAESRLNALLDAAVDAIILINPHGQITRFNLAAERMFGYTPAEVLGRNVSMLMPEPYRSEHDGYIARYAASGERRIIGIGREVVGQRKDGTTFPLDLSVGEFRAGGTRAEDEHGFVGVLRDLSAQKAQVREAEELRSRLAHAGRLGTLGEMVSGIAHEVNQPLTAISTYAAACRRLSQAGRLQGAELTATLDKIGRQAERAGQVIRGLRAMLRKRDEVREPVDCNRLVRDVVRLIEFDVRQSGFRLSLSLAAGLPLVLADGVQVQQVILNLVRNALDAMLERRTGDAIEIGTSADEHFVRIAVRDRGPGLSPEALQRLYEPFFTTKPQGIGLGLSICKTILVAHGGDLAGSNRDDGGAEFCVTLPVAPSHPASHEP